MKKIIIGLNIIVALSPALASAKNMSGAYVGGVIGVTQFEFSSEDKAWIADGSGAIDDSDTGFKLFGGYQFNRYTAIEGFYADLGGVKIKYPNEELKMNTGANSFGVSGLGILPVSDNLEIFAKVGLQSWNAKLINKDGLFVGDNGTDLIFGVGVAFRVAQVSLRGEFERYDFDDTNVEMISVGINYNFY
ncbi:outer membrane beta-barrel protein [Photobacterium sp.]|uniref:outer membrane beta-barrel protein n=1 Tax=Photobacterium sp. TaxID=660 RepID=UPI00299DC84F|nr:outer membrane beta-barrel protein [Photobacterium sp.]MDX1302061.1 outer membrane beta-barrel protein [Photobacterium sp.]